MSRDYSQFLPNKYYPPELESLDIEACRKAASEPGERANNAKCELAWRMKNGRGIAKDEKAARALYEEVIKSDPFHQRAHYELGVMYEMGRGGPEDRRTAQLSYEKLEVGASVMLHRLNAIEPKNFSNTLAVNSHYYPIALQGVLTFLKKQHEKGDIDAPYLLAHFADLLNQTNLPWDNPELKTDMTMTVPYLTQAVLRGNVRAQYDLALCYEHGHQTPKDEKLAIEYMEQAAEQGHLEALNAIGIKYATNASVSKDDAKALAYFERALACFTPAEQKTKAAFVNKARTLELKGIPTDKEKIAQMYEEASSADSNAAIKWGLCCQFGNGCTKSDERALIRFYSAAERGNPIACYMVAEFRWANKASSGMSKKTAQQEAIYWYRTAAELGHQPSIARLAVLEKQKEYAELSRNASSPFPFVKKVIAPPVINLSGVRVNQPNPEPRMHLGFNETGALVAVAGPTARLGLLPKPPHRPSEPETEMAALPNFCAREKVA